MSHKFNLGRGTRLLSIERRILRLQRAHSLQNGLLRTTGKYQGNFKVIDASTGVAWVVVAVIAIIEVVETTVEFYRGPKVPRTLEAEVCLVFFPFLRATYHSSYSTFEVRTEIGGAIATF